MVVRCQDHTGAGVGVTGDPGAVDGKHHEQHQHEHGDYGLDVGTQTLLSLLLLRYMFPHLSSLEVSSWYSLLNLQKDIHA